MKLNITPGPWVVDGWDLYDIDGKFFEDTSNDREAECTAVNNTYHAGINPEAVPDMLDALKMALQTLIVNYPLYKECPEYEFISKAIQKATL